MKYISSILSLFIIACMVLVISSCGDDSAKAKPPPTPTPTPTPTPCKPHYVYDKVVNRGHEWKVFDRQGDFNYHPTPIQAKLIATTGGTVELTVTSRTDRSLSLGAGFEGIGVVFEASQGFDVGVSLSVTASIGNEISMTIPPLSAGHGNYGVSVQVTSGHLYDAAGCGKDYGDVISYAPVRRGWCTWAETVYGDPSKALAAQNTKACPENSDPKLHFQILKK